MSRYQPHPFEIPAETVQVAKAAFRKGNVYMTLRDELGPLFADEDFAALFAWRGQMGVSPGLLAMVTVMQFMEGLTDRQAAEAVRSRIDWKYALGLRLTDTGFDYSILSPFRDRLLAGGAEAQLFDRVLERLKERGLVKPRGRQRTDSTHILAAVRSLNRLELVGETLRRVLDDLARLVPDWLVAQVTSDWFERYSVRFESYRLPQDPRERSALQIQIGHDGYHLLTAIYDDPALTWLGQIASVEVLRQVWIQQYYCEDGQVHWRERENLAPNHLLIMSPDDPEARNRTKRTTNWTGYAVHVTETCDLTEEPNIITHVATTPATTADVTQIDPIHADLAQHDLLPSEHLVDSGYIAAEQLVHSQQQHQVELLGPTAGGGSWQADAGQGFDVSCFSVDWETHTVTCPQGKTSQSWKPGRGKYGHTCSRISFASADCHPCPQQRQCTQSKRRVRILTLRPRAEYEALAAARTRQRTDEFKTRYKQRAGIEGTISQGTRTFGLRRTPYIGQAKTHLHNLATATAINLTRVALWFIKHKPKASTRITPFATLAPVT